MSIPIPAHVRWPLPAPGELIEGDDSTPAARRHGLDPALLDRRKDMVLGFLYPSLPAPPVSAAAALSCALSLDASDAQGADRISALPDDLLRRVVARLPAKDGARTATLSTRWLGLWRSAPLVLVDTHFLPPGAGRPPRRGAASRAVADAVSAALAAHPGPFPFVSLTCGFFRAANADRAALSRWFTLLATRGVDELVFANRPWPVPGLRLPAALFSCASLRRLYLVAWVFPDTATLPRAASFPNLQELVLGAVVMEDRDLDFVLAASPVLNILAVVGNLQPLRARLASRSLRSAQFCMSIVDEVTVVDAPCLERLFTWSCFGRRRIKIDHAPQLSMLGYLEPGAHELVIGNTVIKSGMRPSPTTTVPSVRTLAVHLHFTVCKEVKMLPSFLRCFPNVETLCVESEETNEPTGNLSHKFWQKTGPIECIQSHLKTLVFREFQGEENELAFLTYIAENARVLESLVLVLKFGIRYSSPMDCATKFMALESARWASGSSKLKPLFSLLSQGGSMWTLKAGCDLTFSDPFICF